MLGRVQVTLTSPALAHVQPSPDAETKVTPAGRVSVTVKCSDSGATANPISMRSPPWLSFIALPTTFESTCSIRS